MQRSRRALSVGCVLGVLTLLAATLAACSSSHANAAQDTKKPNIVFVLTDDLAMNLISHMPHVQALQKSGMTMANYNVVDSLCCPSRSAIFTGEYPHDDGVFTNGGSDGGYAAYNKNGDPQKAFALSLQKHGYTTGFMGKYLNGYDPTDKQPAGWNEWDVAGNGYPEFNYTLNENGKQYKFGHDPKDYLVDVMSHKGGDFIHDNASKGKPFMLELATFAPHAPYTPAPRFAGKASNVPYPKTPAYDTTPTNPPKWLTGRTPLTTQQQAQLKASYDKRIEADMAVDQMIGHLEDELKASGAAKNTYIVFSSDNGYHMGEYKLLAGKQTAFDTDIHVPMIASGPGIPAGRTSTQLVSNIDVAPTFETLTGSAVGSTVDGVSMANIWHGQRPADWQQANLIEHHGPNDQPGDPDRQNAQHADPPTYEAVRTAGALYVKYADGSQEYYDTTKDPYELHNIASGGVPPALPKALAALQSCHGATACQAAAQLSG
ncbi:sulfatase [uncultured Jatrophihabitans sp.]|uniref:sulfatase family protein n=1 Tax=uncultured Jatrophihabitans sp. TaxID=1610747 RepID=UPI0035CB943C